MAENSSIDNEPQRRNTDRRETPEPRRVGVSYVPRGYGLALAIDQTEDRVGDQTDGFLRVTDAVVTLEIPTVDGRPAVLAWDPAEVTWDAIAV